MERLAVLGAGAWGTALAILLARNGRDVCLWGRDPAKIDTYRRAGRNLDHLPDVPFPPGLTLSADLDTALADREDCLVVVPSGAFRPLLERLARHGGVRRIAWGTKGLEPGSRRPLHEVVEAILGPVPAAVVSGPSFATEVARGLPTAVTVASRNACFAHELADALHNETFRAYTSDDVVGVEIGGAVKNVLAIAAGISDGLGFGANARAALITRGLAEITRLGLALGGQMQTFMGLAGMGDVVLTCTDDQSRNRRLGLLLGQGLDLDAARARLGALTEGVAAAREALALARERRVEMPITEQVHRVLYQGADPREAVHRLLTRAIKPEAVAPPP